MLVPLGFTVTNYLSLIARLPSHVGPKTAGNPGNATGSSVAVEFAYMYCRAYA